MNSTNQQKNRQRRGPPKGRTPSIKQTDQNALSRMRRIQQLSFGQFWRNFANEPFKWALEAFDTPIQAIVGVVSFVSSIYGILDYYGIGQDGSGADWSPLWSNFQMRVVLFTIIAASIAGSISTIGKLLTIGNSSLAVKVAHIFTFLGAFFLAACTEWIFAADFQQASPFAYAASIGGAAFAVFLAKTNFSYSHQQGSEITASRAGLLANFAVSTSLAIIVIFVEVAKHDG